MRARREDCCSRGGPSRSLLQLAPPDFASVGAAIDVRVLFFTLAVAVVVGVAFGIIPAFQLSRDSLTDALGEGSARASGSGRSRRTRDALVVAEIAVALVLLLGSTLLIRSLVALTRVDTGIDTRNLLTFDVSVSGPRAEYQARQVQFYSDVLERLRAVPGVRAAGAAVTLPIGGDDFGTGYLIEGRSKPKPVPHAGYQIVMPGYFDAMGIPIKTGRDFRFSDTRDSAPVVLVNETLARDQWPGEDPVGRRVRFDDDGRVDDGCGCRRRHQAPRPVEPPEAGALSGRHAAVVPVHRVRRAHRGGSRTRPCPLSVAPLLRSIRTCRSRTCGRWTITLPARWRDQRSSSTLVSSFGALAVLLAIVGVYGMMSWSVARTPARDCHPDGARRQPAGNAGHGVAPCRGPGRRRDRRRPVPRAPGRRRC